MENHNIVLLHGWGGSRKSLIPLSNTLKSFGFKTFNLEMPGHGSTKEMPKAWDMEDFGRWALDEITKLEITNPILVGHSFGGKIILELASSKLLEPSKIVLIDSNGIKPKNSFKKGFWKFFAKNLKFMEKVPGYGFIRKLVYKFAIGETDYAKTESNVRESFKLFNEEHYNDRLKAIDSQTLIIWGIDDKVTPLWMGKKLNEGIKNSNLRVLDGTHGLPLKNPEDVAYLIKEFIQKKN